MSTYQVKIGKATYIVVADDIEAVMSLCSMEDAHREGVTVPVSAVKEVDARVIGIREGEAQEKLWSKKEE